jgi:hypothetical protein
MGEVLLRYSLLWIFLLKIITRSRRTFHPWVDSGIRIKVKVVLWRWRWRVHPPEYDNSACLHEHPGHDADDEDDKGLLLSFSEFHVGGG